MSVIADITQPGIDSFSSVMEFRLRFVDSGLDIPITEDFEFSLPGDETVRRGAAELEDLKDGGTFEIHTEMLSSQHRGPTPFGEVRLTLAPDVQPRGKITGEYKIDPETKKPRPILPLKSSFEGVQLEFAIEQGRFVNQPVSVAGLITGIPPYPDDVYAHEKELVLVSAADPDKEIARGFGRHRIGPPRIPVEQRAPLLRECCPPPQSLVTEGCLGCIDLDEEKRLLKQVLFFAPQALIDLDKTLVYVCITNNGPGVMTAIADGGPAFWVLPGQTSSVAAQQSVHVVLANVAPFPSHHASGHYVITHCCPTDLGRKKRKDADYQD